VNAVGQLKNSVIAFERALEGRAAVTITGRFYTQLGSAAVGEESWGDTAVELPEGAYRDVLTGENDSIGQTERDFLLPANSSS
jgi:maltooligosyltrehalose synthase